ncbi:hypothetical protein AVEN_272689-1 [Araneus ventricosus]|uniref:Uncharacterized protein n=1 Tax=Araneus ventricosus TaxID=182803 RepID=A0A4Y2PYY3_ARAVE|nr:hypothetical protein AVEN_272689-1 [Araneus ventricosus]
MGSDTSDVSYPMRRILREFQVKLAVLLNKAMTSKSFGSCGTLLRVLSIPRREVLKFNRGEVAALTVLSWIARRLRDTTLTGKTRTEPMRRSRSRCPLNDKLFLTMLSSEIKFVWRLSDVSDLSIVNE